MKKALAMLLTLAMALSMLPMAFADVAQAPLGEAPLTVDEPSAADAAPVPEAPVADVAEDIEVAGDIEAPVNAGEFIEMTIDGITTQYADPDAFFAALRGAANKTIDIKLLTDVPGVDGYVPVAAGQTVTLDLNGKALSSGVQSGEGDNAKHYYAILNEGTFTLKDSVGTGTITARGIQNKAGGTMVIESGTIVACDKNGGAAVWNEGNLTINGGTFQSTHVGTPGDQYGVGCLNNSGTALVTGGTFTGANRRTYAIISNNHIEITPAPGKTVTVSGAHGGLAIDAGTAVVNGGSYESADYYGLYVSNDGEGQDPMQAAVTVNGGTFSGKSYSVWVGSDYNDPVNSTVSITGGTFEKPLNAQDVAREGAIVVSGGTYSEEVPAKYLAEDATQVKNNDNTYTVKQIPVAEVNGTQYNSLAKAVAAAQNGQTVKLLENVDISATGLAVHNTVTLDLNGKQIKAENSAAGQIKVFPEGDLTVLDSTDVQENGSGTGKIWANTPYGANAAKGIVAVHGNFTMESGLIDTALEDPTNRGQFGMGIFENGTIVVNGGKIQAGWAPISGNGDSTFAGASITINGGELVSTVDYAIYIPHPGTLTINGGKINGAAGAVAMNRGNLKVTGGEFTSDGTGDPGNWSDGTGNMGVATLNLRAGYGDVNATVTGGTFSMTGENKELIKTSVKEGLSAQVKLEISGGTYSSDVSAYVVEYCESVQNGGVYEVKKRAADKPVVETPTDVPTENKDAVDATVKAAENAKAEGVADAVPTEKVEEALKIAEADPKVELPVPEENQTRQTSVGIQVSVNNDTKFGDSVTGTAVVSYDIKPVLIVQVVDNSGQPVEGKDPVALPLTDKNEVIKAPEGQKFSVELPLPEKFVEDADEAKELIVKHISDSGAYEYVMPKTAEKGKLVIEITHFSTFEITKKVAADGLTISPAKLNATTGSPVRLTATLTPADATENITWSSSDETIATVNGKGEVLPLKPGTVTITAKSDSGQTATAEVTITNPAVIIPDTGIKLDKASLELEPGKTGVLKATLTPSNATYKYIFWESSDEKVATVSDGGLVTAVAEGTATITAKSWYGNTATCEVTVKKADVPTPPDPVDPWPTEGLEGFVTRCYRVALSRDPDKAGHADWVRWLKDGTVDATSCTYGFVFSKEMNNKNLSDEDFVKTLYRLFMDREGEATGVAFWTKYLKDGHSRLEVFNGFTDSVEFARIKASYGIK